MAIIDVRQDKNNLVVMCSEILPPKVWNLRNIAKKEGLKVKVVTKFIEEPIKEEKKEKAIIVQADGTDYINEKEIKKIRVSVLTITGDISKLLVKFRKLNKK